VLFGSQVSLVPASHAGERLFAHRHLFRSEEWEHARVEPDQESFIDVKSPIDRLSNSRQSG
jgi:hypothetical protein